MKHLTKTLLVTAILALAGCGGEEAPAPSEPAPAAEPAPEPADAPPAAEAPSADVSADSAVISLATAIRANPADASKLLAEAGMTLEQFESALFAIAKDPTRALAFPAGQ